MATSTVFEPSSAFSRATTDLLNTSFIICAVILLVVTALITYCIFRFRGRPGQSEPGQFHGHKKLEIVWTAIPCLIVAWLMVLTVKAMNASDPPRVNREPDVIIIGHQFWWE